MSELICTPGLDMFVQQDTTSVQLALQKEIRQTLKARYDAAQTNTENKGHWSNSDNLDPHAASSLKVRQTLRSRSRYEILENNPYLKGTLLSICNDFIGSGPKLRITDPTIPEEQRKKIIKKWQTWVKATRFNQKIWQMRMAKIVDGESFLFPYNKRNKKTRIWLNYQVIETDQVSGPLLTNQKSTRYREEDGVRWDRHNEVVQYHKLNNHPGTSFFTQYMTKSYGQWYEAEDVIHWYRKDRAWHRGIPELAPSLPLCALLRRYTLATVLQKELAADFSAVLETQGPAAGQIFDPDEDDPFDAFPTERGMILQMPYGMSVKQLDAVPDGFRYDEFVGSLLREIVRPALTPFNMAAGTSKDSNMASGILDSTIYKGGQKFERNRCSEEVLDPVFDEFWTEGVLVGELPGDKNSPPDHEWGWDKIGIDHTDPVRVAEALTVMHDKGFLTDEDIQEDHMNRTVEEWQASLIRQNSWRDENPSPAEKAERQANEAQKEASTQSAETSSTKEKKTN